MLDDLLAGHASYGIGVTAAEGLLTSTCHSMVNDFLVPSLSSTLLDEIFSSESLEVPKGFVFENDCVSNKIPLQLDYLWRYPVWITRTRFILTRIRSDLPRVALGVL